MSTIAPLDVAAMEAARVRLDALAKPPGSLGELEAYAIRLAGITSKIPPDLSKRALLVFCADNGVCAEGIGSAPQSVTRAQAVNIARGITGAGVLCRVAGAQVMVADVGMLERVPGDTVLDLRVRAGTGNICVEDAMTREEALAAMDAGARLAGQAIDSGMTLLGLGEMGIGNTTTSAAVLAALMGAPPETVIGIGGGIGTERLEKKRDVVRRALKRAQADASDPISVLAKLGGLDLCAMAGACLYGAQRRVPIVLDGLISDVAALAACRINKAAEQYLFASHLSEEPGAALALSHMGLSAPLRLSMRLGEGSGCPMMFQLLSAACAIVGDMATFEEAGIDPAYLEEVSK